MCIYVLFVHVAVLTCFLFICVHMTHGTFSKLSYSGGQGAKICSQMGFPIS